MRFTFGVVVGLLFIFAEPHTLGAEVHMRVSYEYFPVQYIPGMSIQAMIARSSPIRGGGDIGLGRAEYVFGFPDMTFTRPLIDICEIDKPGIVCDCKITLPRLVGGDEEARIGFEAELGRISKHEMEHCNIYLAHSRLLEERLLKIGRMRCDRITDELRKVYETAHFQYREAQRQFDVNDRYNHYLKPETNLGRITSGVAPPEASGPEALAIYPENRNFKVLDQNPEQLANDGFYKDKDGVWRNY